MYIFLFFIILLSNNLSNFYKIDPSTGRPFYYKVPFFKNNLIEYKVPSTSFENKYINFKKVFYPFFELIYKYKDQKEKFPIKIKLPENIIIPYSIFMKKNLMKKNEIHSDLTIYKNYSNSFILILNNEDVSVEIYEEFFIKHEKFINLLYMEYK